MNSWTVQVSRQWRVVSGIIGVVLVSLGLGAIALGLRSPAAAASSAGASIPTNAASPGTVGTTKRAG